MKTFSRGLWLVPIFAVLMTVPASAQRWTWDFGVYGGYSWYSKLLDSDETGLPDDAAGQTFKWESGFMGGIQIGYNFGSNLGVRLNTRYTDRPIVGSDLEDFEFVSSTNLWAASLDLLWRFKNPPDEFLGTEIYPFLAVGLGAKWMNPGGDQFTCNDTGGGESFACVPFTSGGPQGSVNSRTFAIGEKNSLMGLIGLGADWRLSRSFILRTEINDQIYSPQVYRINQPWAGTTVTLTNEDNRANLINEIGLTLGLHFLFGIAPVPVVAVAPPPPPPPPPVAPPPPPPPREDAITVCVVDPTAPGGLRMQSATLVESRSEEHTSELQSQSNLVCRLLLEKKNVTQRFMDELAQCYNVLPQLDINNTIDYRPEGDEKWFLENEKTVTQFCRKMDADRHLMDI